LTGWGNGRNAATGRLITNQNRFPSGDVASLVEYVYSKGLLFGIYRDRTRYFGFKKQEAGQFAE
jgi:hypothetical protein